MNFRTDEEKTQDIIMYEKKAKAAEICERYKKIQKRSNLVTLIAAVACAAGGFPLFYKAYDKESLLGMVLVILGGAAVVVCARLTTGAILSGSLPVFIKWGSLSAKWKVYRADMHEYEAKFTDQTVFEDDMKKAEKKLMDSSEALIDFAEKNNISID